MALTRQYRHMAHGMGATKYKLNRLQDHVVVMHGCALGVADPQPLVCNEHLIAALRNTQLQTMK